MRSDQDQQVELFRLEIEIEEQTQLGNHDYARELMTQWFYKTLPTYSQLELIRLLKVNCLLFHEAIRQADGIAVQHYSNRLVMLSERIGEM